MDLYRYKRKYFRFIVISLLPRKVIFSLIFSTTRFECALPNRSIIVQNLLNFRYDRNGNYFFS